MFIAPTFTLEYTIDTEFNKIRWNHSNNEIPPMLTQAGVSLSGWQSFLKEATDVVSRTLQKDNQYQEKHAKKSAEASWGGLFGTGSKNKAKTNLDETKEQIKATTEQDWKNLVGNVISLIHPMDVSVNLLRNTKNKKVYGMEFRSNDDETSSMVYNKIVFRHDYRNGTWNYSGSKNPPSLLDGKITPTQWSLLYKRCQSIVDNQHQRRAVHRTNHNKALNSLPNFVPQSTLITHVPILLDTVTKQMQQQATCEKRNEMEWHQLESWVKDILMEKTVDVSLLVYDGISNDYPFLYCGLEFRLLSSSRRKKKK